MSGNTKLSEFSGDYSIIILTDDEYIGSEPSGYDGGTLESFLEKESAKEDYEDMTLDEVNELLEEHGLSQIDFEGEAYNQAIVDFFPNHTKEEIEDELDGRIDKLD